MVIKMIGKQRQRVRVMEIVDETPFVLVSYDEFENYFDEHQPMARVSFSCPP